MYNNAGIRSNRTNSNISNNRHVPSTSDPPHASTSASTTTTTTSFSSFSSLNLFGHHARRSDDCITRSSVSLSAMTSRSSARTPTAVFSFAAAAAAPPSSFHGSTILSSFPRKSSHTHHVPSSSTASSTTASSVATYNINHNKASSSISTSSFLSSRSILPRPQGATGAPTPSVSRSSSISRPGVQAETTTTTTPTPQRINMKRLMSKPTAIHVPDRAQSVMAFSSSSGAQGQPPSRSGSDTESIEDHLAIKSHSLDILRRSRRRSRSVDLMMGCERPRPSASVPVPTDRTSSPPSSAGLASTRGLTRSPSTPSTARPPRLVIPGSGHSHSQSQSYSVDERASFSSCSPGIPPSPSGPEQMTAASVIALAWTESQKRQKQSTFSRIAAGEEEGGSNSTIPQSAFTVPEFDSASMSISLSPVVFADAKDLSIDQFSPLIVNSPEDMVIRAGEGEEPFATWAMAEKGLAGSRSPLHDTSNPSARDAGGRSDGNKVIGVAATMREVSRRLTGAFGRSEKKATRFPINHPPSSFSMPSYPPDASAASPPSPFSAKPVSKAPESHDMNAHEQQHEGKMVLSQSRTTVTPDASAVKSEPLSNDQLFQERDQSLAHYHHDHHFQRSYTTEFGQFNHNPLHIPQVGPTQRAYSVEGSTTPRQRPPRLEMPSWTLYSSSRRTADENGQDLTLSRQTSSQIITSPISPVHSNSERARIPGPAPPPRSNTPNTLKKRSKPSLRKKPSASAVAPASGSGGSSGIATQGTPHVSPPPLISTAVPQTLPLAEVTATAAGGGGCSGASGGKLRGLVKKLSSGALRRTSSQSDRSRSSQSGSGTINGVATATAAAAGNSLFDSENHGDDGNGVPPVPQLPPMPQIPKDFELILDADAYFAERARMREDRVADSDGESIPSRNAAVGGPTTLKVPGSSSQMSSRRSSFRKEPPQISTDTSSLCSSSKSRLKVDTEIDRTASGSKKQPVPVPARRQQQQAHGVYTFPKRADGMVEHSSSSTSQSTGMDHIGAGYRSSSPSLSSSDLHVNRLYAAAVAAAAASTSFEEKGSLSSHSHDVVSSYSHSMIAQPIMAPKDLYQHGEDEAATLRRQQSQELLGTRAVRRKKPQNPSGGTPATQKIGSQDHSPVTPPPPTLSPSLLPLTAPPPRPPRRVTRVQSSTVLDDAAVRPTHHAHQRSLSSPISPNIPTFLTNKVSNPIPLSKRSRSVGGSPRSPKPTAESPSTETSPSTSSSPAPRARSSSLSKKAKHLPHLVVRPRAMESASNKSPHSTSGGYRSAGEGGSSSQPKVRVKTSLGTITRVKSLITPKSATSHTPSSSTSYTTSPQSSGRRSSSSRTSRDHSFGHGWVTVDEGEAPPVPFTSTAFTFKEISPAGSSPEKGKLLTEGEREDLWNALLSRSDRVGGTLTITMDQTEGPALLSDNASFREG